MSASKEEIAAEIKDKGNVAFKAKEYRNAAELYKKAIEAHATAACYGNLAQVHIKLEEYGLALADADNALKCDATYVKAYYRKGSAFMALGKFKDALKQFQAVVKAKPKSKVAKQKLKECKKIVQRERFQRAIASEHTKPASEAFDLKSMTVDASYTGPRLATDEKITLKFVKAAVDHMKAQKKIDIKIVGDVILRTIELLKRRNTLMDIEMPKKSGKFTVIGDVHGQFYDLLNIFELNGLPSEENPYLFNGDFVDRGSFSVEVILTLFMYQLLYPKGLYLTRGNHETKNMNKMYGFEGEVKHKYTEKLMAVFQECFCWLPLCAVIEKKVFVVHGGIFTQDGVTLDDIRKIPRTCEPPESGPMCDMLWSDPSPHMGRHPSKRGVSSKEFGADVTKRFLENNGLELLVRSHEVKQEGYEVMHDGKCVTIFSAPNYCDQMGNKGAMMIFDRDMVPTFKQFTAVPHPPIKPMAYAQQANMFGF